MEELQKNDLNMFNAKNMDAFCHFVEYVLTHGGNGYIFCSALQYASWWRRFCACEEEVEDGSADTKVAEMETMPLFYSREHGDYLRALRLKWQGHKKVVKEATHF